MENTLKLESIFAKPKEVTGAEIAFGGNMRELLPPYNELPENFRRMRGYWADLTTKAFFEGLSKKDIPEPKDGIDKGMALAHIKACLVSFEPKHEHKTAGVAYLFSLWFKMPEAKHER